MDEIPREPPVEPGERVERHEVVERTTPEASPPHRRSASPMWPWILPLVAVALILAWYVFTRGEPESPIGSAPVIEIEAPDSDPPEQVIDNRTTIELPDVAPPEETTPPTEGEPAAEETPAGQG